MIDNAIRSAERKYAQLVADHAKRTGHPYNATGEAKFQEADDAFNGIEASREAARQQLLELGGGGEQPAATSTPKPWPGAQAGQRKRDGKTGITWEMQSDGTLHQVK